MAGDFGFTLSAKMGAIAMGPAISWLWAAGAVASSASSASSTSSSSSSSCLFLHRLVLGVVMLVVDLGLKGRKGRNECLHLLEHCLVLLAGVGHVGELLLHLLLCDAFGGALGGEDGCFGVSLSCQSVDC